MCHLKASKSCSSESKRELNDRMELATYKPAKKERALIELCNSREFILSLFWFPFLQQKMNQAVYFKGKFDRLFFSVTWAATATHCISSGPHGRNLCYMHMYTSSNGACFLQTAHVPSLLEVYIFHIQYHIPRAASQPSSWWMHAY